MSSKRTSRVADPPPKVKKARSDKHGPAEPVVEEKAVKPSRSSSAVKVEEEQKPTALDVAGFYELEDKLAEEAGTKKLGKELLESTKVIREQLMRIVHGEELSKDWVTLLAHMGTVKRNARLSHYANALLKKDLAQQLEGVEAKYMQLQNVKSEIQHLQKEIARCLEFRSADEAIELVPVEEFYANAPDTITRTITKPDTTRENEHELRLARLTYEMSQRKQLVATLQELEGRRSVLISDINGKEQRLKSLKPKIEALIKSAKPVQEVLGVRTTASSSSEQRQFIALLPPELSVLYVQAEAYKDIVEDSQMSVAVGGDVEEATARQMRAGTEEKDDDGSDDDGNGDDGAEGMTAEGEAGKVSGRRRHRITVSERLEEKRTALITPHPIHLNIDIGCGHNGNIRVTMMIQYLPELRISTLKWKVSGKLPTHGGVCAVENLFDELFAGDSGEECPSAVGAAKLAQLKVDLSSSFASLGRPYKFVQRLTGTAESSSSSSSSPPSDEGGVRLADVLQSAIISIRNRVAARVALAKQLKGFEAMKISETLERENLPALPEMSTLLKGCKLINEEQFLTSLPTDSSRELYTAESPFLFHAQMNFEHPIAHLSARAWCALKAEHPRVAPFWVLTVKYGNKTYSAENSLSVKSIENWLNVSSMSVEGVKPTAIFAYQMLSLWTRVELFCEVDPMIEETLPHKDLKYERKTRGRECEMPLMSNKSPANFSFR